MRLIVGTSGYSYKEWKGSFYPDKLPASAMLAFYAERFETVEINNTFYRMPEEPTLARWRDQVPPAFSFVLKAPQRISHQKKLVDVADDVRHFTSVARSLGPNLGPLLVQLPPFLRKDAARLQELVSLMPADVRLAFEVRHSSWLDEEIFSILRSGNVALCASDTDEVAVPDELLVSTADWGYLRLRRTEYGDADLEAWHRRIAAQPWKEAWVFFKHEDEGKGPAFAKRFLELGSAGPA